MNQSEAVAFFLSTPFGTHFRYVDNVWFAYEDGDWVLDRGHLRLIRAITNTAQDLKWVQGGNDYMISRVRRELSVRLRTDRLPGRLPDLS